MFVLEPKAKDPQGLKEGGLYLVISNCEISPVTISLDTRNLLDPVHADAFASYEFEWVDGRTGRRTVPPLLTWITLELKMMKYIINKSGKEEAWNRFVDRETDGGEKEEAEGGCEERGHAAADDAAADDAAADDAADGWNSQSSSYWQQQQQQQQLAAAASSS
jgi:hypothetical protein